MKKLCLIFTAFMVSLALVVGTCWAASTATINTSATVANSSPELSVTILEFTDGNPDNNPWTNSTEVPAMNFGTLEHLLADGSDAGLWYSKSGFCVVIFTQPFSHPYDVRSTSTGLVSGAESLPAGSFGLTPVYSEDDEWCYGSPQVCVAQGPMPTGATLGDAGSAVATDKLVYSSEPGEGTARIIQAYYGLPPYKADGSDPHPGFEPIPLTQAPGTYTGTVTITIAVK